MAFENVCQPSDVTKTASGQLDLLKAFLSDLADRIAFSDDITRVLKLPSPEFRNALTGLEHLTVPTTKNTLQLGKFVACHCLISRRQQQ